jgi:hypothetical protein
MKQATAFILALVTTLFTLSGVSAQTISYVTPDAAAPGMTVVLDFVGPNSAGNFGSDGFYAIDEKVTLTSAADSIYVKLGPSIVSWEGKFLQTMLLIEPSATPRTISLTVIKSASERSNVSFSLVNPTAIAPQTGGGTLGFNIGTRSRRGTMVVDSLVLSNGTYGVATIDPDLSTNGNQGYLPFRLLSKGPIRLNKATINARGKHGSEGSHGGPGGGGGGGGALRSGGDGFTGGGGVGPSPRKGGDGTGSTSGAKNHFGGLSLNGVAGGLGTEYGNSGEGNDEGGGGGTGHPFGTSGQSGVYGANSRDGGRGAGSGGGQGAGFPTFVTYGGGGAGHYNAGNSGEGQGANAGQVIGNRMIVPLAGGSGGGSGNIWFSSGPTGHGGGGGGAVELTSFKGVEIITSAIDASGGNGSNGTSSITDLQHGSGGGAGSGGAIHLAARDSIHIRSTSSSAILNVNGGSRGTGYNDGGDGGKGRIRLDGRISDLTGFAGTSQFFDASKDYIGPAIANVTTTDTTVSVRGYARGWGSDLNHTVRLFYRFSTTGWQSVEVQTADVAGSYTGSWLVPSIRRPADIFDTTIYLVALQQHIQGASDQWTREPNWVMSHASGMIGDLPGVPRIEVVEDTIDFGRLRVGRCKDSSATVQSTGSAQLNVGVASISGDVTHFLIGTTDSLHIPQLQQDEIALSFCPKDTGCFEALVRITSNGGERLVRVMGCGIRGEIATLSEIDFGRVRAGTCKDTTIIVSNTGTDTLTITRQVFTNADFSSVSPALPISIAPGEQASITLRYCANSAGVSTGTDTLISDAGDPDRPISLSGQTVRGVIQFESMLDFGEVLVGSCKDSFVTITNIGDDTVFVNTPPVFSAEFTVDPAQLPIALAAGESRQLFIRFCPADEVNYASTDSVRPERPVAARAIEVRGKGVKGLLSVPNAVDHTCVIVGETIMDTLIVENIGSGTATNINTSVDPTPLTIVRSPANALAPAAKDTLIVSFTPTAVGDYRGTIRISSNGLPELQIPYTAHVTLPPMLQYSTTMLDFDTVDVGATETLCVRVTNPSCRPITITSWRLKDGDVAFELQNAALPVTLADSATFEFCVVANSGTSGIYLDSLVLTTSIGELVDVSVSANVERIRLRLEPDALDFGVNDLNVVPPTQQATITNIGTTPTTLTAPVIAGPDAALFTFSGGTAVIGPSEISTYDITYLASSVGDHSAYFIANTGLEFDTVFLTGRTVPVIIPQDTVNVTIFGDTVFAMPGDIIRVGVRTVDTLSGYGVTTGSFRVQFHPMRLDLRRTVTDNALFDGSSLIKHSLGDWTVTLEKPDTVVGLGPLTFLEFEVLLGNNNEVPIRLSEVELGQSYSRIASVNDGMVSIMECDTTSNISISSFSQMNAIRPNPARGLVHVPLSLSKDARVEIRIFNTLGVLVKIGEALRLEAGEHLVPIDLNGMAPTLYLLDVRVKAEDGEERHRTSLTIE